MGRKALERKRKVPSKKVNIWLAELLIVLQEKNLEKLTIDDIAILASKSKSTIYEYFESKEDVILAACQTRVSVLSELILKNEEFQGNSIEKYKYLVESFIDILTGISISFLHQIRHHYPSSWKLINELTDNFIDLLSEYYRSGMKEGLYQPVSIELLSHLDKYFVTTIVTDKALFSDTDYSLSELVKDYLNLRLTGLLIR